MKHLTGFLFALAGLLFLASCGRVEQTPTTFVFARGSDAEKLDPADVDDGESVNTLAQCLEGLVRFRPGTLEVEPWLAESFAVSPDGLTYTFEIREGVTFHDGTPLDAQAAAYSFQRQLDPDHPAHLPQATFPYWNYLYQDVAAVNVTGPMTLEIVLSQPNASMLASLATFPVWLISPESHRTHGLGMQRHPLGTGPYRFVSWRPGEAVVFARFEDYWGPEPAGFEGLVMRAIPENSARVLALKTGDIHGADGLAPAEVAELEADERFTVHETPGMNVGYMAISSFSDAMEPREVRQAIAMAIDRAAMVELAFGEAGEVAEYPLPPGFLGVPKGPGPMSYNPEEARRLLADFPELAETEIELAVMSNPRPYMPDPGLVASLIRSDLEAVGLNVRIVTREWNSHLSVCRNGDFDLALLGWNGDNGDTDNFLSVFFGSWSARMGSANNIAFYINPVMDDLLLAGRKSVEPEVRQQVYEEALALWSRDLPLIPLMHGKHMIVLRREVGNFTLSRNTNLHFGPVRWEE